MSVIRSLEKLPIVPPARLVGRTQLFEDIHRLSRPEQAVFLYGIPGVGKSALAATLAANRLQAWGQVLWLKATRGDLQTLAGQVLRAYGVQAAANADEMVMNLLQQHTPLIVINGLASHEIAAQFIWKYAAKRAPVLVLHDVAADGPWEAVLVRRLDAEASLQLFTDALGNAAVSPAAMAQIVSYCDGHPFSLRLAALQIAGGYITPEACLEALPPPANDPIQRALAVIGVAFSQLDAASQGLLLAMSAGFSNGLSVDLLSRIVGAAAHQLSHILLERGFITRLRGRSAPFFEIHPLVQQFALSQLQANERLAEAQNRMLEAVIAFTRAHAVAHDERHLKAILLEMDNLLNAGLFCLDTNRETALEQLLYALNSIEIFIYNWGYRPELRRIQNLLEARRAAAQLPPSEPPEVGADPAAETLVNPSRALATPLQTLQMHFDEAAARHDRPEMARLALALGYQFLDQGQIEPALERFRTAVTIFQDIGDLRGLLIALQQLAEYQPQAEIALEDVRRALNIAGQLGDDEARCRFLGMLADLRVRLGDIDGAMDAYKRAIKLGRLIRDAENTGIMLGKLAALYMDKEHYREATLALSQAITLFGDIGRRDLEGRSLGNLGTALGYLGRWREAGQRHAAALRIARELNDVEEERFQLQNLAYVAEMEGHLNWAANYTRQALYLAMLQENTPLAGELAFDLGRLLMDDTHTIGQAVALLEYAAEHLPEASHLLKQARIRLQKAERSGKLLAPVERDLLAYSGAAYRLAIANEERL